MGLRTYAVILVVVAVVAIAVVVERPNGQFDELAVHGKRNAYPSIAASGRFVAVGWGVTAEGGATDVYTAVSRDAGRTFERPTRANDDGSMASLSGEQPPRVTLVPRNGQDPSIVVIWTARAAAGTRLLFSRSDDRGRSFTRPAAVPGSDAPGNRGWQAATTDREGRVLAMWLDHRELATTTPGAAGSNHAEHQLGAQPAQQGDGTARAQLSKLFFARVDDPGSAHALTGGVCYCCKTTLVTGTDGTVYAAWRHVYPGSIRDIAFAASRDEGRTFTAPVRVSTDDWVLNGCPENGPAMVVDPQHRVHVAWPTLLAGRETGSEPTLALFYARSQDGRQFTPRQRIPTEGVPRHVDIALAPDGAIVTVWDEGTDGARRVAFGRGVPDAADRLGWQRRVVSGDTASTYPVLAPVEDGVVVAWVRGATPQSVIHVERVRTTD